MVKTIADDQIRDTNTKTYIISNEETPVTLHYSNGLDADVTVVVEATHGDDDNFAHPVTLENGKTVGNGSTGYDTMGYPWDKVRLKVTAASTPSSGSFTAKKME